MWSCCSHARECVWLCVTSSAVRLRSSSIIKDSVGNYSGFLLGSSQCFQHVSLWLCSIVKNKSVMYCKVSCLCVGHEDLGKTHNLVALHEQCFLHRPPEGNSASPSIPQPYFSWSVCLMWTMPENNNKINSTSHFNKSFIVLLLPKPNHTHDKLVVYTHNF